MAYWNFGIAIVAFCTVTNYCPSPICEALSVDTRSPILIGLDGADDLYFGSVNAASLGPNGEVFVVDGRARAVVAIDPTGRFLWRSREGGGPGEFIQPQWVDAIGDTLVVFDRRQARFTYLAADGRHLRTEPAGQGWPPNRGIAGRLYDGSIAYNDMKGGWPDRGLYVDTFHVEVIGASGEKIRSLGPYPASELYRDSRFGVGIAPVPFGRTPKVEARRDLLVIGHQTAPDVVYRRASDPERRLRIPDTSRPVDRATLARYITETIAALPEANQQAARTLLADVPTPARTPPYGEIRIDRAGRLWVQRFPLPGDPRVEYWVTDWTGQGATLPLPANWTVLDADETRLVARVLDEYDVEGIAIAKLRSGGAR